MVLLLCSWFSGKHLSGATGIAISTPHSRYKLVVPGQMRLLTFLTLRWLRNLVCHVCILHYGKVTETNTLYVPTPTKKLYA